MSINEKDLKKNFIPVEGKTTIANALDRLRRAGASDSWLILIKHSKNAYSAMRVGDLVKYRKRMGTSIYDHRFADIVKKPLKVQPVQQTEMGIGQARTLANRSLPKVLPVLNGPKVIGYISPVYLGGGGTTHNFHALYEEKHEGDAVDMAEHFVVDNKPSAKSGRYVNLCVQHHPDGDILAKENSLATGRNYALRMDIGRLSPHTIITGRKLQFPDENLPPSTEGWWLDVVVDSKDFRLDKVQYDLFLPTTGRSWACSCKPGQGKHTCDENERSKYLIIPIQAPDKLGLASLRLAIYFHGSISTQPLGSDRSHNHLIQSLLFTADIAAEERAGIPHTAVIDFTLASRLTDLDYLPHRGLNILTNDNHDGTHSFIVKGKMGEPISFVLNLDQIGRSLELVRQALADIHFKTFKGVLGSKPDPKNLLNDHNGKTQTELIEDLKNLAILGSDLWNALITDRPRLSRDLRLNILKDPTTIQVGRLAKSNFVFPWAMVYDIPNDGDYDKLENCQLLKEWDDKNSPIFVPGGDCKYKDLHGTNTLCPYGFWGIKHKIEQPPSVPEDWNLALTIVGVAPLDMAIGYSTNLDGRLTNSHIQTLENRLSDFSINLYASLDDYAEAMGNTALEVIYFYGHGMHDTRLGAKPYLEIGVGDKFFPNKITTLRDTKWQADHWQKTSPLVFINGCHTVEITPEELVSFVDAFAGAYAAGVIGTEITIDQFMAGEAAEIFFSMFKDHKSVGDALQQMRLYFLSKGNLLGLAYTPYCSADLKLV
jgi:hypothetical protein